MQKQSLGERVDELGEIPFALLVVTMFGLAVGGMCAALWGLAATGLFVWQFAPNQTGVLRTAAYLIFVLAPLTYIVGWIVDVSLPKRFGGWASVSLVVAVFFELVEANASGEVSAAISAIASTPVGEWQPLAFAIATSAVLLCVSLPLVVSDLEDAALSSGDGDVDDGS